jgi:hypothetical protein
LIVIALKPVAVGTEVPMEDDSMFETDQHPMIEGLYNQLSQVSGFQDTNGHTYEAYVKSWRERYGVSAPTSAAGSRTTPSSPHVST